MRIIRKGSLELPKKIKRFHCKECGCIFEAEKSEYQFGIQYNETYYYCQCPTCGKITYKEIPIR